MSQHYAHGEIDNLIDMYELGGAMIDLTTPGNFGLWGEGLHPEMFEDYFPYIRALEEMGMNFNVAATGKDFPLHLPVPEGAGGAYFSDQDEVALSLPSMGAGKVYPPEDVSRWGSSFAHETGHAVMDVNKIWENTQMHTDRINAANSPPPDINPFEDPDMNRKKVKATQNVRDYYRSKHFTKDYDFSTKGVPAKGGVEYNQSIEDFYKFHDLKQKIGEQIFEITEKTGDLFKGNYAMWGARDINLSGDEGTTGKLSSGHSVKDQKIINTIGNEFLAEYLGDKWSKVDIMYKGLNEVMGDDPKMNISDLVSIIDAHGTAGEMVGLSKKYGGFPEELWNLFDIWEQGKAEINPGSANMHGITVSKGK